MSCDNKTMLQCLTLDSFVPDWRDEMMKVKLLKNVLKISTVDGVHVCSQERVSKGNM